MLKEKTPVDGFSAAFFFEFSHLAINNDELILQPGISSKYLPIFFFVVNAFTIASTFLPDFSTIN